eukprot:gnl/MRDRNA2_/MRDRNA2_79695_c0_seq1.p1 gnl/MRDRNA2_/MRDRNA2_79695_c0~~gnl/MRDRNA2_/MRDRNA2_79695_c0_seq1.p1  ORF type:complete len:774 (+),score=165.19 gnl/MRDRNA2_/MRDRNA2_79695_c0_seq1:80-2323(+)
MRPHSVSEAYDPLSSRSVTNDVFASSHHRSQNEAAQDFSKCFDSLHDSSMYQSQYRSQSRASRCKSSSGHYSEALGPEALGPRAPTKLSKLSRPISQATLSQADQAGVLAGKQVWRNAGNRLFKALKKKKAEAYEFAAWQDDCRRKHAAHDRFRAKWWQQWRNGLSYNRRAVGESALSPDMSEDLQTAPPSRMTWAGQMLQMVQNAEKSDSNERSTTPDKKESNQQNTSAGNSQNPDASADGLSNEEPEVDLMDSPIPVGNRKTTTGKKNSVLSSIKKNMNSGLSGSKASRHGRDSQTSDRIMALMEARRAEFDCMPVPERDLLRQAFMRCDSDGSSTLDPREVRKSLAELGIQGKTPEEKRVVTQVCRDACALGGVNFFDFVFQIVPAAKLELHRVRRSVLRERFEDYDLDDSGTLSQEECKEIVMELSAKGMDSTCKKTYNKDFVQLFAQCQLSGSSDIDFEGFVILLQLLEEHQAQIIAEREKYIATSNRIPQRMVLQYRGELIPLFEAFEHADTDGSCYLERKEVMNLMIEMGLSANEGHGREIVEATLEKLDLYEGIGFLDFLCLVKGVRQEEELMAHDQVQELFYKYDTDHSGYISFAEASEVISDLGLSVSSIKDKNAIRELFEEVDQNGGGDLDVDEFYVLMQKCMERLRAETFQKERDLSQKLGYSSQQVEELKDAFHTLDEEGRGEIKIEQLKKVPELLGYEVGDLAGLLCRLDEDFTGSVDFLLFMKFMSGIKDAV